MLIQVGGAFGAHYDSDKHPSVYRERVMTVYLCLETVDPEDGGEVEFPHAHLKIRCEEGMAIVYHNTAENGALDRKSLHADAALVKGEKWTATLGIHATQVPLASRTVIPALAILAGGEPPRCLTQMRRWFTATFTEDRGFELFNYTVLALALVVGMLMAACAVTAIGGGNKAKRKPSAKSKVH